MARKGENIYKRKDGRWEGRYIKEYDENGKAKYGYLYAYTYKDVKQKLIAAKSETSQNIRTQKTVKQITFGGYSKLWLKDIRLNVKHSTFVKYTNIVTNHILPYFENYAISRMDTELIKQFANEKLTKGNLNKNGGLSAKTVRDILSVLKLLFRYIESQGEDINCDFEQITIKSSRKQAEEISLSVQTVLTQYLLSDMDNIKLGILICLYTGIRLGEICAMKYKDVFLDDKILRVNKTMQRIQTISSESITKTDIIITPPKSIYSQRAIPLPDFLVDKIKDLSANPEDFLLTGEKDKFIEPRTMENHFKRCLKSCGLKNYTFHQLRHRFASYCIEIGFDVKSLSEILGHSDVNITLNRYVHSSLDLKRKYMNQLQANIAF